MSEPDDRTRFEEEGIPDLQDGTPQQHWSSDPQEAPPVGREEPLGADEHGVTADEQRRGESLDDRLARDRPDPAADPQQEGVDSGHTDESAGRIVEQDRGAETDVEKETTAEDAGVDGGGFEPEESAMRIEPEEDL